MKNMEADDDKCPESNGGHEPDFTSVSVTMDGGTVYIDVNCVNCGRSGCLGTLEALADAINW